MSKKKLVLPKDLKELGALLNEWSQKRQKFEFEAVTGKLKKMSDLADARRKMAQVKTKIREIESKGHLPALPTAKPLQAGKTENNI